ncbi:MAG: enoyl-CoA hydratase/isomerase family protein [Novosphingobium sp.]|nr:enoyl-CoA hydratase/isomerase family protein [Novosphingobium sp.]
MLFERRGAIAIVSFNRPERRNSVTVEACRRVYEVLGEIAASDARAVILRGAGTDFCAGADLGGQAGDEPRGAPPTLADLGLLHHAATLLHTMPQVTIAAIDGGCAGAGMGYAAACDFRFASDQAKFSTAFLNVGVSGDIGLAWSLTRIVGGARARELLFFPEKFDAAAALEHGLVTRVFPRERLHAESLAAAEQLCGREPFALRMMKANLVSAEELSLAAFIDLETARQLQTIGTSVFRDRPPR